MIDKNEKVGVEIKEFILERFHFYVGMIFKNKDLFPKFEVYTKEMMNNKIFELVSFMFGKQQKQEVRLETPKTWRDWIKKIHSHKKWMKWIIKRFPIKYNYHHYILNEYTVFPNLDLPSDFEGKNYLVFYDYKKIKKDQ